MALPGSQVETLIAAAQSLEGLDPLCTADAGKRTARIRSEQVAYVCTSSSALALTLMTWSGV